MCFDIYFLSSFIKKKKPPSVWTDGQTDGQSSLSLAFEHLLYNWGCRVWSANLNISKLLLLPAVTADKLALTLWATVGGGRGQKKRCIIVITRAVLDLSRTTCHSLKKRIFFCYFCFVFFAFLYFMFLSDKRVSFTRTEECVYIVREWPRFITW